MNGLAVARTEMMRRVFTAALKRAGCSNASEVETGDAALHHVEQGQPLDVILIDTDLVDLPIGNVVGLIRRLSCNAAILVVCGESQRDELAVALRAGADGYLIKPFPPDALAQRIRTLIARESG